MQNQNIGTIVCLKSKKGYGFLRTEDGREIFFHASGTLVPFEELREGQEVIFTAIVENPHTGRERAVGIQPMEEVPSSTEVGITE